MSAGGSRTGLVAALTVAGAVLAVALAPSGAASAAGPCASRAGRPWCDKSLAPAKRARLLLGALTRKEKISLLAGDHLPEVGLAGTAHKHAGGSEGIPRLGVPTIYFTDGPAGLRQGRSTALPAPLALAATWSPTLAREHGTVVGDEAKRKGNDVVYAPTVNIMRTPVGGRTFEGYGEDPFLDSQMTVAWIKGAQGNGVIAAVKHFAVNNQEGYGGPVANRASPKTAEQAAAGAYSLVGDRRLVDANVDERTLHEVYLPQFEAAVKRADVGAIMCAYNKVNGEHACRNWPLLTQVLRGEWGFRGIVLSDYGAAHDTGPSLRNGLDFEPWPGTTYSPTAVEDALAGGEATMADVNLHVRRILRTLFAFGAFERPAHHNSYTRIGWRAHARTAQRIEESAITLLKNKHRLLPLNPRRLRSIAVIGAGANRYVAGGGSSEVTPFSHDTPLQAIRRRVGSRAKVLYSDGADRARAAATARRADVAVVFAPDFLAEGVDRNCLTLECPPLYGDQDALINRVAAANDRTVVVLETGGPVLTPWRRRVSGLLEAWYPGERGGAAIARVLFGDADPGGRLPATFPRREADTPTAGDPEAYPGVDNEVFYKEGVLVGYRWYDAHRLGPAYPFGFGLSYARFRYSRLKVEPLRRNRPAVARVSFEVTNLGARTGTAVPELYLRLPSGPSLAEPPKELKGFDRLRIRARHSKTGQILLTDRDFSHWATGSGWAVNGGCYGVRVGSSSRDLQLGAVISLEGAGCGRGAIRAPGPG